MKLRIIMALGATAGLAACAPVAHYHPEPMAPAATAARLEGRRLPDPGLRQFMEKNLGRKLASWPLEAWDPNQLELAAYYFNPQMQIARARVEAAQAAVITAGARPNPTLSLTPGVPSPYLLGLDLALPVMTAGRRGYKIEQAKALGAAARDQLAGTAWQVRSGLRTAALGYFLALRQETILRTEVRLRAREVQWLNERLAAGETAKPEVDSARLELLNSRTALGQAEGRASETQAALAGAIGVPAAALAGIRFSWRWLENPPEAAELSTRAIERAAVVNRLDVRQSLAEYAAAEAALQLEIARQHPNFQIGPGYQFEEGDSFVTLGLSVTLPVFNRNQGPIAEAEARRKEAAARFLATQAAAIAQSETALARYRAARAELEDARRALGQIQNVQKPAARQAVAAGESDSLLLNRLELAGAAAAGSYLNALGRAQAALGALEDAVERPLRPGELPPPDFESVESKTPGKEAK